MVKPIVLFDACVLYPAPLRDLLMHLSLSGLFQAKWTHEIHEEWMRNLLKQRPDLKREQLERTRDLMNLHALDALVEGYECLIESLTLPDLHDRHVLSAAIHAKANTIVTFNLKDFPALILEAYQITALHPDDFVTQLLQEEPLQISAIVNRLYTSLKNPPLTKEAYLSILKQQKLVDFVAFLKQKGLC